MSNEYNSTRGNFPTTCLNSTIPPNLGPDPPGGLVMFKLDAPMVSVANAFQQCAPPSGVTSTCPVTPCCGGGPSGESNKAG